MWGRTAALKRRIAQLEKDLEETRERALWHHREKVALATQLAAAAAEIAALRARIGQHV